MRPQYYIYSQCVVPYFKECKKEYFFGIHMTHEMKQNFGVLDFILYRSSIQIYNDIYFKVNAQKYFHVPDNTFTYILTLRLAFHK